ncbi:flagellar assembly peptidoglycan hydrolase FlgJ [Photobacterium indicum]|jgi:flagellar rod assembly protein/muramidase FlgJ|uniref:Peptidoglycan hydrolase FlgJ n=1 Tax=Photobacterium indicum TaxID=81447 RepID=A0A2T3LBL5_9GAMM|nr:flagellar assembly peptidoglycan hydrolase FlgJ [Photobacterium indicum]PSV48736.1 flagellar assembly peptidoglycan hydrolase FlgJ [Photobacterium indicum]
MKSIDPGFVHDISSLERLRAGIGDDESGSLRAAAQQFEAIFTQMLFKSMRQANEAFESDLTSNSNSKFFEQMHDEQLASELSSTGSLGLADLIVQQLGSEEDKDSENAIRTVMNDTTLRLPVNPNSRQPDQQVINQATDDALKAMQASTLNTAKPPMARSVETFDTPKDFVTRMRPYAEKAANAIGTDPSVLIAQAALETGWGKKVIKNAVGSSNNLFNIKADPRWSGNKVATNTLEFHNGIAVQEKAAFRSYENYQDSFNDYVRFLNDNPRYSKALENPKEPAQFIRNIHNAGYATDPKYTEKVLSVMDTVKSLMK